MRDRRLREPLPRLGNMLIFSKLLRLLYYAPSLLLLVSPTHSSSYNHWLTAIYTLQTILCRRKHTIRRSDANGNFNMLLLVTHNILPRWHPHPSSSSPVASGALGFFFVSGHRMLRLGFLSGARKKVRMGGLICWFRGLDGVGAAAVSCIVRSIGGCFVHWNMALFEYLDQRRY